MVDQKFKLQWWVSAFIALALLAWLMPAEAAKDRQAAPRAQASAKKTGVKSTKAKPSVARAPRSAKARSPRVKASNTRRTTSAMAVRSERSRVGRAAPRSGLIRTSAQTQNFVARDRIMPVMAHASPSVSPGGKTIIASPSLSASAGVSFGKIYGLHQTADPLELKSSVALVLDQDTNEVLVSKNSDAVLPIASLTKLMTAMVVLDARLSMDEMISISQDDVDTEKNSSSRLAVGSSLTRGEALHLALMSSENRAAHALGRHFPGGLSAFVAAMNVKAQQLGMFDTHYVEPTGLSSQNQSSARDLASLVKSAYQKTLIRELSTSPGYAIQLGARQLQFRNTNSLVRDPNWDIGLQKTGYIVEAGRCLVMQARMAGRKLIMVFLDSTGKYSRLGDAERVRRWVESQQGTVLIRQGGPSAAMPLPVHKSTS